MGKALLEDAPATAVGISWRSKKLLGPGCCLAVDGRNFLHLNGLFVLGGGGGGQVFLAQHSVSSTFSTSLFDPTHCSWTESGAVHGSSRLQGPGLTRCVWQAVSQVLVARATDYASASLRMLRLVTIGGLVRGQVEVCARRVGQNGHVCHPQSHEVSSWGFVTVAS